ncbi:ABC transporter ATP-binding protein [bacterium]|nr:MAG: ABC transporter ATP-binding protein [bacterium]
MAEIRIKELRKRYGLGSENVALDGIDLTVRDGEVMALLGPSGCGKTTTLNLLGGFLEPDGGEIWVGDRLLSRPGGVVPPEQRHMSLIFQSYAVWPHKTVFENVAFGLSIRKVTRFEIKRRVEAVLRIVGMHQLAERYPAELSGGQQQRVALARAMVVEPEILLADEPLSNLDANLREEMRFEIRRLHDQTGITMVYVTHDQAEAMVTADRIALLNHGRVEQVGTPEEMYRKPRTMFAATFIGRSNTLEGTLIESGLVECGGVRLRATADQELPVGAKIALCVRPHDVWLSGNGDANHGGSVSNHLSGRVLRQIYLGESRDYLIEIDGGAQVRALTTPAINHSVGDQVELKLPVEACRVVQL